MPLLQRVARILSLWQQLDQPNDLDVCLRRRLHPLRALPVFRTSTQSQTTEYVLPHHARWLYPFVRTTPGQMLSPLLLPLWSGWLKNLLPRLPRHRLILLPVLGILFEDGLLWMILTSST